MICLTHWQYAIKRDRTRRSCICCDGSPRAVPILHGLISTYSSCVEQPTQRLFYSLSTSLSYCVYGGDALDAFAHSPPPAVPTCVSIDDAYANWYSWKTGHKIACLQVLPVLHAHQGHLESGKPWESHINSIFFSPELKSKCTTCDRISTLLRSAVSKFSFFARLMTLLLLFLMKTLPKPSTTFLATALCSLVSSLYCALPQHALPTSPHHQCKHKCLMFVQVQSPFY